MSELTEQLHVYEFGDGADIVIAASEDDAIAVFREYYGPSGIAVNGRPETAALNEDEITEQIEWLEPIDDSKPMAVWWDSEKAGITDGTWGELITKPASEWAALHGRGWFSTDIF